MSDLFTDSSVPVVYVGTMEWPFRRMIMFHMASPDLDALHSMAEKIGMKREWFQDKGTDSLTPHYDISKGKKKLAIQLGAVEINDREIIKRCFPKLQELKSKPRIRKGIDTN